MKTNLLIAFAFITFTVSAQSEFITTWKTVSNGETIMIPTKSGERYDYTVEWGDGKTDGGWQGNAEHTYDSPGEYEVKISGEFPAIYFNDYQGMPNTLKIQSIDQWGDQVWSSMENAFYGCRNLTYNATDIPNLTDVSSLAATFRGCTNFNGNISGWDVSSVTMEMKERTYSYPTSAFQFDSKFNCN